MPRKPIGSTASARFNGESWRAELTKVEKQIALIVEAIANGMYHPVPLSRGSWMLAAGRAK